MRIALVLNRRAGALRGRDPDRVAEELAQIFRANGYEVDTTVQEGRATVAAIRRLCQAQQHDVLVVGGGDGTGSAAAAAAAENGIALGILPLGTMNLFARSLRVPLRMREAAAALAAGDLAAVDIAEVNGRLFIHHVTLGLHPNLIAARERLPYGSQSGKIWANLQAWWIALGAPARLRMRARIEGREIERESAAILVSNNLLGHGHLPYADDLTQGLLGLYVAKSSRMHDLVRLSAQITLGEIATNPLLESWQAAALEMLLSVGTVEASVDGELVLLKTPLRFATRKGGLTILRPAEDVAPGSDVADDHARARHPVVAKEGTAI